MAKKRVENKKECLSKEEEIKNKITLEPLNRKLIDIETNEKKYRALKQEELTNEQKARKQNDSNNSHKSLTMRENNSENVPLNTLNEDKDSNISNLDKRINKRI